VSLANRYLWQKYPLKITDITDSNEKAIKFILVETGTQAWIKREYAELYGDTVYVPRWLAKRILNDRMDNW